MNNWTGDERRHTPMVNVSVVPPTDSGPTLGEIHRLVERIDRAVNGNGQPGLVQTVAQHAAWLKILGAGLLIVGGAVAKVVIDSIPVGHLP